MKINDHKYDDNVDWEKIMNKVTQKMVKTKKPVLLILNEKIINNTTNINNLKNETYELITNELMIAENGKHNFISHYDLGKGNKQIQEIAGDKLQYNMNKHLNIDKNIKQIKKKHESLTNDYNNNTLMDMEYMEKEINECLKIHKKLALNYIDNISDSKRKNTFHTAQKFNHNIIPAFSEFSKKNGITKFLYKLQEGNNHFNGIINDMTIIGGLYYTASLHLENLNLESINLLIKGMKIWILYPPVMISPIEEYIAEQAKDDWGLGCGNLKNINNKCHRLCKTAKCYHFDPVKAESERGIKGIWLIQKKNQLLGVPSGWYHMVFAIDHLNICTAINTGLYNLKTLKEIRQIMKKEEEHGYGSTAKCKCNREGDEIAKICNEKFKNTINDEIQQLEQKEKAFTTPIFNNISSYNMPRTYFNPFHNCNMIKNQHYIPLPPSMNSHQRNINDDNQSRIHNISNIIIENKEYKNIQNENDIKSKLKRERFNEKKIKIESMKQFKTEVINQYTTENDYNDNLRYNELLSDNDSSSDYYSSSKDDSLSITDDDCNDYNNEGNDESTYNIKNNRLCQNKNKINLENHDHTNDNKKINIKLKLKLNEITRKEDVKYLWKNIQEMDRPNKSELIYKDKKTKHEFKIIGFTFKGNNLARRNIVTCNLSLSNNEICGKELSVAVLTSHLKSKHKHLDIIKNSIPS